MTEQLHNLQAKAASSDNFRWHSRGYLPHCEIAEEPQMLTFRLSDSLPIEVLKKLEDELKALDKEKVGAKRRLRLEALLDQGIGKCYLSDPSIAQLTTRAIQYFHGQRYSLHAWVIMPNHVHVLISPSTKNSISEIIHSWKSFTAQRANAFLGLEGSFWQREYFDRRIRNDRHFEAAIAYIHNNPMKAGLCENPRDWQFSSAGLIEHYTKGKDSKAGWKPALPG